MLDSWAASRRLDVCLCVRFWPVEAFIFHFVPGHPCQRGLLAEQTGRGAFRGGHRAADSPLLCWRIKKRSSWSLTAELGSFQLLVWFSPPAGLRVLLAARITRQSPVWLPCCRAPNPDYWQAPPSSASARVLTRFAPSFPSDSLTSAEEPPPHKNRSR